LAAVSNLSAVSMRAKDIPSFTITALSVEARPYTVPSASIPAIAFGGVALLVAGIVALRRGSMLA
jgi:succinate-acetate transporter protein